MKKSTEKTAGLWHYTVVPYLPAITASGAIRPATALVGPEGVKAAVWCSTNAEWEETANKMLRTPLGIVSLDRIGTHEHSGLARIAVRNEAAPHTWADYQRLSGESRAARRRLELSGAKNGRAPRRVALLVRTHNRERLAGNRPVDGEKWERAERAFQKSGLRSDFCDRPPYL